MTIREPQKIIKSQNLMLKTKKLVHGVLSGLHRSYQAGQGSEFVEHKEYSFGDDIKHLDWKVYGKREKFYIKRFENETNLKLTVCVDCSGSMDYGEKTNHKGEYALLVASVFLYLAIRQQDSVGLALHTDDKHVHFYVPRSNPSYLSELISKLEELKFYGKPNFHKHIYEIAERIPERSMLVFISDFLDISQSALKMLKIISAKGNDVVVLHLLHPDELSFPFDGLAIFESMEDDRKMRVVPRSLKKAYLKQLDYFLSDLKRNLRNGNINYHFISTGESIKESLVRVLNQISNR